MMTTWPDTESTDWLPSLMPDEQLLWVGRPSQQPIAVQPRDAVFIPFSLVWASMASGAMLTGLSFRAPMPLPLFSLVFFCAALYVTFGRFAHNWLLRSRTRYALTSHRALIRRGRLFGASTAQQFIEPRLQVQYTEHKNGKGTIQLGRQPGLLESRTGLWSDTGVAGFQFWKIPNAGQVATAIQSRQHEQLAREMR